FTFDCRLFPCDALHATNPFRKFLVRTRSRNAQEMSLYRGSNVRTFVHYRTGNEGSAERHAARALCDITGTVLVKPEARDFASRKMAMKPSGLMLFFL